MEAEHQTPLHCPSCAQAMRSLTLARYDGATLTIDLCTHCYVIWFDHGESTQLAPAAVIELFKEIHAHRSDQRNPLPQALACPRCHGPLALTHDIGKAGPLTYYRCQHDLGRLTPFFQFLREKQFVRSLTPAELHHVQAEIKQVQCPSCGAPVDLEHSTACTYCGAPIAVLDADAVQAAMHTWADAEARRTAAAMDPRVQALTGKIQVISHQVVLDRLTEDTFALFEGKRDLMSCCIGALGKLITSLQE